MEVGRMSSSAKGVISNPSGRKKGLRISVGSSGVSGSTAVQP